MNYSRDEESIVVVVIWVDIGSSVRVPVVQSGFCTGRDYCDQIGTLPNFNSNQDHVNVNKLIQLEDMVENMIAEIGRDRNWALLEVAAMELPPPTAK